MINLDDLRCMVIKHHETEKQNKKEYDERKIIREQEDQEYHDDKLVIEGIEDKLVYTAKYEGGSNCVVYWASIREEHNFELTLYERNFSEDDDIKRNIIENISNKIKGNFKVVYDYCTSKGWNPEITLDNYMLRQGYGFSIVINWSENE